MGILYPPCPAHMSVPGGSAAPDAGAQGALGVDAGEAEVVGGEGAEAFEGAVSRKGARRYLGQEPAKLLGGHVQFRRMFVKAREPA